MPRGLTDKVVARLYSIFEYIKNEICTNTKQIMQEFGLTHSQAFHVLQMLRNQGLLDEYVIGKMSWWCIARHLLNDIYVDHIFVSALDLEYAICKILENAKGRKATIRTSQVADKIAERVHINPRQPLLLAYVSEMLPIVLSNVNKDVFKNTKDVEFYVVDTCSICEHFSECPACETLRKKLNC